MKLSKIMIKVFAQIMRGNNTFENLAKSQQKSVNRISEIVQELEEEHFVVKKRSKSIHGGRVIIEVAGTNHAIKLKEIMFRYSTIKFEEILTDSKLLFLTALCEDWMDMRTATRLIKISRYMIERYRSELKNRGIIINKNNLYKLNEKAWPDLTEFLVAYKNYALINGYVRWKYQEEIIFEVDDEKLVNGSITGLARYKDYNITVNVISALCKLPETALSKEEVFVHSLFEVNDPRTLHLALTFYLKNKLSYNKVIPTAMKYGKYTMFENFVKLLKTKEDKVKLDNLPVFDRKDFIRIANMYGVEDV